MALSGYSKRNLKFGLANTRVGKEISDILDYIDGVGNRFYVDSGSGADTNSGTAPDQAFATLDYSIAQATANNGDVIYVLPGHTENLAAASAVDIDVAGLTIIGLGHGASRPTFTATAVAGDFKLAAASTVVKNILFLGGIDATTGIIEISANDCILEECEYRDSTGQATDVLMITANSDRVTVRGCKFNLSGAAGPNTAIASDSADDLHIHNCYFYGDFILGAIQFRTTLSLRCNIHDCFIWTEGAEDLCILDTITGTTGVIGPNVQMVLQDDAGNVTEAITGATFYVIDDGVHVVNAANQKSLAINWTAVADS